MTQGQLTFDPKTHEYHRGLVKVPGVSDIMDAAGLISEFCKDDVAAEFGRIFHTTMSLRIQNRLGCVDQKFINGGWLVAIEAFVRDQTPAPYVCPEKGVERILFSKRYGYAGTLDFIGSIKKFRNKLCLPDWKTIATVSKSALKNCDMQTAAYEALFREYEEHRGTIRRAMVHFKPGEYRIYELNSPAAWPAFQSCLNLKRWKDS